MATEKEIRLHEVELLKQHCDDHGVAKDNPDHTIRQFIRKRVAEIEKLFEEKPAEETYPEQPAQQAGSGAGLESPVSQEGVVGESEPSVHAS